MIEKKNLQFVEHNVEETIDGESIVIKFNIYEGEKILVERINILGNNVTNENVIRGELLLDEGDPFTNLKLSKSISKIKSRRIFGDVTSKVSNGSSADLKIIDIFVEEKPTGEISAGAGIGTDGGSFALVVTENNWLGEGKNISFDVDGLDPSIMPATGTPVPGGLNFYQSLSLLKSLINGKEVVGFDVVELAPIEGFQAYDFTAASLVYKIMELINLNL